MTKLKSITFQDTIPATVHEKRIIATFGQYIPEEAMPKVRRCGGYLFYVDYCVCRERTTLDATPPSRPTKTASRSSLSLELSPSRE